MILRPILYEEFLEKEKVAREAKSKLLKAIFRLLKPIFVNDKEALRRCVNFLIVTLYEPSPRGYRVSRKKLAEIGCENEAINWGNLRCSEVERVLEDDGGISYVVTVSEADKSTVNLQRYIFDWLREWGWPVKEVRAEW